MDQLVRKELAGADAQRGPWRGFFVPEIHDVHAGMDVPLEELLSFLPDNARKAAALLVVPDWEGRFQLQPGSDCAEILRLLPNDKVLHGLTHSRGKDFFNWLVFGHENRSEFPGLSEMEERRRINTGRALLEAAIDSRVQWFCAPRWQHGQNTQKLITTAGFSGFLLRDRIETCEGERAIIPALCFDDGDRKFKSLVARHIRGKEIERLLASRSPFRLTIHASDPRRIGDWKQLLRVIESLEREGWQALSIEEALARNAVNLKGLFSDPDKAHA